MMTRLFTGFNVKNDDFLLVLLFLLSYIPT